MLTPIEVISVLAWVEYKDGWTLNVVAPEDMPQPPGYLHRPLTPYLQWIFNAPDLNTGELEEQRCRKWQLSYHMTQSELVRTAFKAALAAEEHEASEAFKYKGAMIYDPHLSLDDLALAITLDGVVGQDYR